MRTSKKMLSLFLALVMVVTSCSVGFTAFAADGNKTDPNLDYWNGKYTAEESYEAFETLIGGIFTIPAVKRALEAKNEDGTPAKNDDGTLKDPIIKEVTDDTTLKDLIVAVSPLLTNALADKSGLEAFLSNGYKDGNSKINTIMNDASTGDWATAKNSTLRAGYSAFADPSLGKSSEDSYSFYTLYAFGNQYKGESGAVGDYGKRVSKALETYTAAKKTDDDATLDAALRKALKSDEKLRNYYDTTLNSVKLKKAATADLIANPNFGYDALATITTKADFETFAGADTGYLYDYYNNVFSKVNGGSLTNAAELVFYHTSNYGKSVIAANIYLYLMAQAGKTVKATALGSDVELTANNAYNQVYGGTFYDSAAFAADYVGAGDDKPFNTYDEGGVTVTADDLFKQYALYAVLDKVFGGEDGASGNYGDLLKGLNKVTGLVSEKNAKGKTTEELQNAMLDAMGDAASVYRNGDGSVKIAEYFMDYCTANKKSYKFSGKDLMPKTDEEKVAVANAALNSKVGGILSTIPLGDLFEALVGAHVDLGPIVDNIWQRLYDKPLETVFNLLPTLLVIIDGILPVFLRDDIDDQNAVDKDFINNLNPNYNSLEEFVLDDQLGGLVEALALNKYSQQAGNTTIGIGALHLDLNKTLPAILHWVTGDKEGAIKIVGTYPKTKTFKGAYVTKNDGTVVKDPNKIVTASFNSNIPVFTNIYVADEFIYALNDAKLAKMIKGVLGDTVKNIFDNNGIKEIIHEVLCFTRDAVDDYLTDVGYTKAAGTNDKNYLAGYEVNDGLNDIKVALPKLIDQLGKNFMKKYNVKSDWEFNYYKGNNDKAKIRTRTVKDKANNDVTETYNYHFDNFVELYDDADDTKKAVTILTSIVDLLIGNWINALLDFLNDVLKDDANKITSEVPLVQGLLAALGDFGDQSIITDALNGLFQLKRVDKASFTLTERRSGNVEIIKGESDTKFCGFSLTSGFFLISNVRFKKAGQIRGLWPFIETIANKDKQTKKADYDLKKALRTTAPLLAGSKKTKKSAAGTDYSELLTKENKKAAQKLVDALDEILASLLENTSINGFDLDKTDNLLSGFATVFAAYFGAKNTDDIVKLFNNYLFFVTGESHLHHSKDGKIGTQPTKSGDVNAKKVYTSANLSNFVIQTYSVLENLIDYLFYNEESGVLSKQDPNMLIADALYGIISPDAVAIRMSKDYSKTADILKKKDYLNWNSFKVQITGLDKEKKEYNTVDFLKYGFKAGDKKAFYDGLGESLNGIAGVLGALFVTSYTDKDRSGNLYSEVLYPLLKNLADGVGADGVMAPAAFNKATAPQQLIDGIMMPIGNILSKLYAKPLSFILNLIKGLAGFAEDSTIRKAIMGVQNTANLHLDGLSNIVAYLSPSYGKSLKKNIGKIDVGLPEKNILVTILNKFLAEKLGFALPDINWEKLNKASTSGEVLLLVYGYVVDTLLGSDLLTSLIDSLDPNLSSILKNLTAAQILQILTDIIGVVQSPTEVYWSFSEYAGKLANNFVYPRGITARKAYKGVQQLDQIAENIFPLLNGLGVTDIESLGSLVNDKLYTNEIITSLAKALYGAINGNETVVKVFAVLGMDMTTKGVANYLMDKSYGKTYSSAARTLRKAKSWDKIESINWGFTNGSANAQTGFINGLAAALRPLNQAVSILLAEGRLGLIEGLDIEDLVKLIINELVKSNSSEILTDKGELAATLTYKMVGSDFVLTVQSYGIKGNGKRTLKSVLKIDVNKVAKDIEDVLDRIHLTLGTNGYESAIVPLLEAFMCDGVKTYKQYKRDIAKAKDNLLIDILKPIGNLLDRLVDKPFDTLTAILPNLAYFLDSNGLSQAVGNLLAPITAKEGLIGVLAKDGLDVDVLVEAITGKDLGTIIGDLIGTKKKLKLELTNLKTFNIQDIVIPLVNKILKDKNINIELPDFSWATLASHGTIHKVRSAARNDEGKFITRQVDARQGEVLVAVLRYIADTLIKNAQAIKDLLGGIDAIKNNATIKAIIDSVFDTISLAHKDDIVRAVFYILCGDPTDKFFDYRNFKTKKNTFSFGDLDEDFCRKLAPMLDGLIAGIIPGGEGLTGLVAEKLYTDELIGKLCTGLYGAIEGVNISDSIGSLADLLAQTDIDATTEGVAALLTNPKYGRKFEAAAATIRSAGSWKNIEAKDLAFGVTDRDSFMHALVAALRPLFGVLDTLLNDQALNLFNLVGLPGSDGYSSAFVPLLEALGVYNIKTQYQYREDCFEEYDNLLLDIINPLWDKVEDILAAPLEVVMNLLPNLALVFANDGLLQIIDNLITPITALLDALKPIANVNDILKAAGLDVPKLLKEKVGLNVTKFDLYDIPGTLKPLLGADNVVGTVNAILPIIKIKGASLNLELPDIDWLKLASHGKYDFKATSQVACFGRRIAVKGDEDETLIAVLRFLIDTINYKNNYKSLMDLLGGLFEGNDTVAGILDQVFGMLQGDSDTVIKNLVDLLQTLAG